MMLTQPWGYHGNQGNNTAGVSLCFKHIVIVYAHLIQYRLISLAIPWENLSTIVIYHVI